MDAETKRLLEILELRITLFEKYSQMKYKRLADTSDNEKTIEALEELAQLGVDFINDIKIDCYQFKNT